MRALRVCARGHRLGDGLLVPSIKLKCCPCTAMKTKNGGGGGTKILFCLGQWLGIVTADNMFHEMLIV